MNPILTKLHPQAIEFIRRHSMDDCARSDTLQFSHKESKEVKEKMVQVSKVELGGTPYLNKKIVQEKGVKKVKILTEFAPVETEFEGKKSVKLEGVCSTVVDDPKKVTWQMNDTTRNYMIDKHGSDTAKWIGLEIDIAVKQAGSASPGVYPKDCNLEKVLS